VCVCRASCPVIRDFNQGRAEASLNRSCIEQFAFHRHSAAPGSSINPALQWLRVARSHRFHLREADHIVVR